MARTVPPLVEGLDFRSAGVVIPGWSKSLCEFGRVTLHFASQGCIRSWEVEDRWSDGDEQLGILSLMQLQHWKRTNGSKNL